MHLRGIALTMLLFNVLLQYIVFVIRLIFFYRLSLVDENYRLYFRGANEEDEESSTRKRKRTEKVLGAPGEDDWENARYIICFTIIREFIHLILFALFYSLITFVLFSLFVYNRGFIEYLRIFFNATKKVSGSQYVTANLFFGELVTMHATIARMCLNVDEKKKKMTESMKVKYDKYWGNIDNVNFCCILH